MSGSGVRSVSRALGLLRHLARRDEGESLSDLARACGLPVATAHRLLATLEAEGFAICDPTSKLWHVGREAFSTGLVFGRRHGLAVIALPHLRRLRDLTRETANVGVMMDGRLVTIAQVESREIMRAISAPGGQGFPATASGMGKAILATWPEDAVRDHVGRLGLTPLTRHSHRTLDGLLDDLGKIRARGWALDDEEHVPGLRCIAAPIFDRHGEAEGAISISGLSLRLRDSALPAISEQVRAAARAVEAARSGSAPGSGRLSDPAI